MSQTETYISFAFYEKDQKHARKENDERFRSLEVEISTLRIRFINYTKRFLFSRIEWPPILQDGAIQYPRKVPFNAAGFWKLETDLVQLSYLFRFYGLTGYEDWAEVAHDYHGAPRQDKLTLEKAISQYPKVAHEEIANHIGIDREKFLELWRKTQGIKRLRVDESEESDGPRKRILVQDSSHNEGSGESTPSPRRTTGTADPQRTQRRRNIPKTGLKKSTSLPAPSDHNILPKRQARAVSRSPPIPKLSVPLECLLENPISRPSTKPPSSEKDLLTWATHSSPRQRLVFSPPHEPSPKARKSDAQAEALGLISDAPSSVHAKTEPFGATDEKLIRETYAKD